MKLRSWCSLIGYRVVAAGRQVACSSTAPLQRAEAGVAVGVAVVADEALLLLCGRAQRVGDLVMQHSG